MIKGYPDLIVSQDVAELETAIAAFKGIGYPDSSEQVETLSNRRDGLARENPLITGMKALPAMDPSNTDICKQYFDVIYECRKYGLNQEEAWGNKEGWPLYQTTEKAYEDNKEKMDMSVLVASGVVAQDIATKKEQLAAAQADGDPAEVERLQNELRNLEAGEKKTTIAGVPTEEAHEACDSCALSVETCDKDSIADWIAVCVNKGADDGVLADARQTLANLNDRDWIEQNLEPSVMAAETVVGVMLEKYCSMPAVNTIFLLEKIQKQNHML